MKTKLALFIFLLAIGGSASAQLVLPICSVNLPCPGFPLGSVQAPIDQNGWRNFKVTLTSNVTSFSFQGIPPSPAQASVNIIFTQDATGGRTVTFAAGITSSCTVTATASATTLCQFEYDGIAGQWFSISGGGSSSSIGQALGSVFTIGNTACGSTPNCLQWVDDDATDNCGTATTNFLASINAYAGPGQPQLTILGSSSGKAYKFATAGCHLEFDIPTSIHLMASLDCAQPATTTNCIQFGAVGQVSYTNAQIFKYQLDGGGTITGGVNLSNAGIEVEGGTVSHFITGINFKNFGATNATLGNCTNFAIQIDNPVAEGTIAYNQWQVTDTGTGRCAFANQNGAGAGTNTMYWIGNTIGGQNATNLTGCSSQAIIDGGSYGLLDHNNIYAFGVPVRIQGGGQRVTNNNIDTATCTASSVNAAIQYGANGSSANINSLVIMGNAVQFGTNHTTNFFQKAGNSTATISDVSLIGNMQVINSVAYASTAPLLVGGNPSCGINGASTVTGTLCYEYGNSQMTGVVTCGNTSTGWQYESLIAGCASSAQTANLGATLLYTPPATVTKAIIVNCQILLTTAATTSSTLPQCVISYTDAFTSTAQSITVTPVWASGTVGCSGSTTNTLGNSCQGSTGVIAPKQGTAVNYSTTGYASTGGTAMQYQAFVRAIGQ